MSISPCGRDVVLASREGLHIIDLDSPYSPPRYLPHHTSWEVADVQWSPFASRDYWVVSTSNQKALVWNLEAKLWQNSIELVLHGHTRAITDINFSAHHPDVLATCAVDSFVHCWDLRTPARPAVSFSDWFAGATQVKWSRQDSHVLASSHDRFLRVWDDRKGAHPLHTIEAHDTKIYGVDWNRFEPTKIVTCSLDKTIKFWNLDKPDDGPERTIKTTFPIWRARHTPFGWGLLAMPQRGNYDLHLYDRRASFSDANPVKSFEGHKAQVKEFLWRAKGTIVDGVDHREWQLVTWGADKELKLHKVDHDVMVDIGYEPGVTKVQRLNFTRKGAFYKTFRDEPQNQDSPIHATHQRQVSSVSTQEPYLRPHGSASVGMSKISLPQFRGWARSRKEQPRTGMHGKAKAQQAISAISWMKNVRINSWEPESLADEITQVGDKLKKVDFEDVDVNGRRATVTLHGPWGEKNSAIYLRVEMRFPKLYPQDTRSHVRFTVQKTAAMSDVLMETLTTDMQTIAETYASRRKGCLEAILRYLLRDQSLEQTISHALDEHVPDPKALAAVELPDDLSSDDEDDQVHVPTDVLKATNANVRLPLPKACGALWSDNGMLVCFFPPKTEQPSMMDSLELPDNGRARSVRIFEGFGRLHNSSPGPKPALGTKTTADDDTISESSSTSSTSSHSSKSSDTRRVAQSGHLSRKPWHRGLGLLERSHSAERSSRSLTDLGADANAGESRANVISVHDFSDMIPSKLSLAQRYRIFGYGPDVCAHNASVAYHLGLDVIGNVWELAGLILENTVPLDLLDIPGSSQSVLIIAEKAKSGLTRKDSGVDLNQTVQAASPSSQLKARVRWGKSPLGPGYLVPALFEHFEATGDIQMLAMLSCVFAEPRSQQPESFLIPHTDHDLALELKAPAFSVDYYPSTRVAESEVFPSEGSNAGAMKDYSLSIQAGPAVGSGSSEATHSEDANTNPLQVRDSTRISFLHSRRSSASVSLFNRETATAVSSTGPSATGSLSTSPEETRINRVLSTGSVLPSSNKMLLNLHQSYSNSPPNHSGFTDIQKSHSPSSSLAPSGWSAAALFGGVSSSKSSRTSQQASAASSDEQRASFLPPSSSFSNLRSVHRDSQRHHEDTRRKTPLTESQRSAAAVPSKPQRKKKARIKTTLHNQNSFDLDGYASLPLLDPGLEWKYKAYRANYAHLLGGWELYPQMAEILKFDGLIGYFGSFTTDQSTLVNMRRRKTMTEDQTAEKARRKGLELRRRCQACNNALAPIEKNGDPIGWHCTTPQCPSLTSRTYKNVRCLICQRAIRGLMVPCLECGHVTCMECAEMWFTSLKAETGEKQGELDTDEMAADECPSGCGCHCSTLTAITVAAPALPEQEPDTGRDLIEDKPLGPRFRRQKSHLSHRSERLMSQHGPDTAIGAFLALTRSRSISAAKESILRQSSVDESSAVEDGPTTPNGDEDLNPWASSKFAGLGRGYGGGFSRGLSTKSSDATIRKDDGR